MHFAPEVPQAPYAVAPKHSPYYLEVSNVSFKTLMGSSYEHVSLSLRPGEVAAICGHNGTGKTSLLLTLSGHMIQNEGSIRVGEYELPRDHRRVQRLSGKSVIKGLNDLQMGLSVYDAMAAEFSLHGVAHNKQEIMAYLRTWDLERFAQDRIKMLSYKKRTLLGIALACVHKPGLLVVDDIEWQLTINQSKELMQVILTAARTYQMVVVVGVLERTLAEMADQVIYLEKEGK